MKNINLRDQNENVFENETLDINEYVKSGFKNRNL